MPKQPSSPQPRTKRLPLASGLARPNLGRMLAANLACFVLLATAACSDPTLVVGKWMCLQGDAATRVDQTDPIGMPWSTGFEHGFCDYEELAGFCYNEMLSSYETVTSPVHSGRYAAAFHVTGDNLAGHQTRCVRQGELPTAAYYGVWYLVPAHATSNDLWNLVHFQGGDSTAQHGLWDISLENDSNGDLQVFVFDFLNGRQYRSSTPNPIPIGTWFHLELFLKRAADATGEVALYQDGQLLFDMTNLVTDDTSWGQWYVGNYATGLSPPDSTLYVDDITIRSTR